MTSKESSDALAIREAVQGFYRDTGRNVSSLEAVTGYLGLLRNLPANITPEEACRHFLPTRCGSSECPCKSRLASFVTRANESPWQSHGKRSQLSPVYVADTARMLDEFSNSLTALDVCDVTKQHLDLFIASH